jgi:hypothetical protein
MGAAGPLIGLAITLHHHSPNARALEGACESRLSKEEGLEGVVSARNLAQHDTMRNAGPS